MKIRRRYLLNVQNEFEPKRFRKLSLCKDRKVCSTLRRLIVNMTSADCDESLNRCKMRKRAREETLNRCKMRKRTSERKDRRRNLLNVQDQAVLNGDDRGRIVVGAYSMFMIRQY